MDFRRQKILLILIFILLSPTFIYGDSFKISDQSLDFPYEMSLSNIFTDSNSTKDWKYVNELDGISNFEKSISETTAKAYKGVCIVNSPIKTIFSVISDVKNHYKWVKYCESSKMVDQKSQSHSTQYYQFDIPWPFANRDMVINSTTDINWEKGKVVITSIASDPSDIPENETFIRVAQSRQKWELEQLSPNTTKVTFTSYTPLKDSDSLLLKKMAATTIPFSTLEKLKVISAQKYKAETSEFIVKSDTTNSSKETFKTGAYN